MLMISPFSSLRLETVLGHSNDMRGIVLVWYSMGNDVVDTTDGIGSKVRSQALDRLCLYLTLYNMTEEIADKGEEKGMLNVRL